MPTQQTIIRFVSEIEDAIRSNASKQRRMKKATLLKKLGLQRLSASSRDKLVTRLRERGIGFRSTNRKPTDWSKLSKNDTLIFELDEPAFDSPTSRSPTGRAETGWDLDGSFVIDVLGWWGSVADGTPESRAARRSQHGRRPSTRKEPQFTGIGLQQNNRNHLIVFREEGRHKNQLFSHQEEAVCNLDRKILGEESGPTAGLLVIPTGGGKTRTAVHWLLKNVIDEGGKVLWIAHRTELLNQAALAFRNYAFSDVLSNRDEFVIHLVSGQHDRAVKLKKSDDVIIASIQSLLRGSAGEQYLKERWLRHHENVFLVIDEAHHAPARSYRNLIDVVKEHSSRPRILGLTATPFRTAERERGHVRAIFRDDIFHKNDLRELISDRVLSTPEFRTPPTNVRLCAQLTDQELAHLERSQFDWSRLDQRAAESIGGNRIRNRAIVDHYLKHRETYGQTIVFALNVPNAIALDALFRSEGVRSDFVVHEVRDARGTRNRAPQKNLDVIKRFRSENLDVLINVNILTEGIDLPNTRTVFLARPTTSRVLMMQMIGRGLRGTAAGGTKKTYIVSFLDDDDWQGRIQWVNPEQLFLEENVDFTDSAADTKERLRKLISLEMLQQYSRLIDQAVPTEQLFCMEFMSRVPLGIFSFPLLPGSDSDDDRKCDVLVYSGNKSAFDRLFTALPNLLAVADYSDSLRGDTIPSDVLQAITERAEREFFYDVDALPGYRTEDIAALIQHYYTYETLPGFIAFEDRDEYDVDKLAERILREEQEDRGNRVGLINDQWDDSDLGWQDFFGGIRRRFVSEVYRSLQRIEFGDDFPGTQPRVEYVKQDLEDLSLWEIRQVAPKMYQRIEAAVAKRDPQGYFVCNNRNCLCSRDGRPLRTKNRFDFEIDHITPRQHGGKTREDNLQLLCVKCNKVKGGTLAPNWAERQRENR